jgi:hypothetical protein
MVADMALRRHKSQNRQMQDKGSFICLSQEITQGDDIGRRNTNRVAQNVHRNSITVEARGAAGHAFGMAKWGALIRSARVGCRPTLYFRT